MDTTSLFRECGLGTRLIAALWTISANNVTVDWLVYRPKQPLDVADPRLNIEQLTVTAKREALLSFCSKIACYHNSSRLKITGSFTMIRKPHQLQ